MTVQPHGSALKRPIAGTSLKEITNWEPLTDAEEDLEGFISSSPRNPYPYFICIYTGPLEDGKNGAGNNPVQTVVIQMVTHTKLSQLENAGYLASR